MRNIVLILQYEGTNYSGWQRQENALTVQEIMENALERLTGNKTAVTGCSRTDSGVHAKCYVCNFKTESKLETERFIKALNSMIPKDIAVTECYEARQDFHSRYNTKSKTYIYTIDNSKYGNVFLRNFAWHYPYALDLTRMKNAAECFCGTHDFKGFMSSGSSVKDTTRTIYDCTVTKEEDKITIKITGDGFLYNMVRIIAGTLVYMGNGKIDYNRTKEIIKSGNRNLAGITAPPLGLCLYDVRYE